MKTYTALQEELQSLRDSYTLAGEEDKKKMAERAEEIKQILKDAHGCYTCDLPVKDYAPEFPYCNKECHEKDIEKNPIIATKREGRILPIDYIKKELLRMGKEAKYD